VAVDMVKLLWVGFGLGGGGEMEVSVIRPLRDGFGVVAVVFDGKSGRSIMLLLETNSRRDGGLRQVGVDR